MTEMWTIEDRLTGAKVKITLESTKPNTMDMKASEITLMTDVTTDIQEMIEERWTTPEIKIVNTL